MPKNAITAMKSCAKPRIGQWPTIGIAQSIGSPPVNRILSSEPYASR